MKKVEIVLKCFGVLIAVAGFYVSQVGHFPWGQKGVSPKFVRGMEGFKKLKTAKHLISDDEGFSELNDIIIRRLKESNPLKDFGHVRVETFEVFATIGPNVGGKQLDSLVAVRFVLSDGDTGPESIGSLRTGLEEIRSRDVFRWMAILLFLGIALVEVPTIVFQMLESRRKNKRKSGYLSHVPPI